MTKRTKIERNKATLEIMVRFYAKHHRDEDDIDAWCKDLVLYAHKRLDHCPFGSEKPACHNCKIHCYSSNYRAKIKQVMKYSGPRMMIYQPRAFLNHLMHNLFLDKF